MTDPQHQGLVLLVDDYQDCREMYGAFLSMAGYRVLKARDGLEALQLALASHPDIILMDLGMPGMDGVETTLRLKSDARARQIPVVALTAQPLPSPEGGRRACFETYIAKPCLPDQLAVAIHDILGIRHLS